MYFTDILNSGCECLACIHLFMKHLIHSQHPEETLWSLVLPLKQYCNKVGKEQRNCQPDRVFLYRTLNTLSA